MNYYILAIVVILIIMFIVIAGASYYLIFRYKTAPYSNPMLSLLYKYPSWFYPATSNNIDFNFRILTTNSTQDGGTMQVVYYDIYGMFQGYVAFQATFGINGSVMTIIPTKLITTPTQFWPKGETWSLTLANNYLTLNQNGSIHSLKPV